MCKNAVDRFGRWLVHQMRKIGLFRRLILSFLFVILIPTTAIGSYFYLSISGQNRQNILDTTQRGLQTLESSITERLKRYEDVSYTLYLNEELRGYLRECAAWKDLTLLTPAQQESYDEARDAIGHILNRAAIQYPDILNIEIITDRDEFVQLREAGEDVWNSVICLRDPQAFRESEAYTRAATNGSLPLWYNTARDSTSFHLQAKNNTSLGQYITLTRTISERWKYENLGTIVINVSLNVFHDLSNPIELETRDKHSVLIGNGNIVMFFGVNVGGPYISLGSDEIEQIKSSLFAPQTMWIGGQCYVVNSVSSKQSDWLLASLFPESVVQNPLRKIVLMLVLIILGCTVLAIAVSFLVTVSVASPIRRLYHTMREVRDDSMHIRYEDTSQDEVGVLGQRFNSMLERIHHLIYTVYTVDLEKKEESLRRQEARLDALQMQINPHFLYNTLDIIRWQTFSDAKDGSGKSGEMLVRFSELLKYSTHIEDHLVRVRDEIAHVKSYICVFEFDTAYPVRLQVDLAAPILELEVPKLSLQPLIENAYIHAFSENMEDPCIWIHSRKAGDDVELIVENNGREFDDGSLREINERLSAAVRDGQHIGLHNVNERLRLHFGSQYGLQLHKLPNGYTAAILKIPGHQNADDAPDGKMV